MEPPIFLSENILDEDNKIYLRNAFAEREKSVVVMKRKGTFGGDTWDKLGPAVNWVDYVHERRN